jgi:hypothetical protein
MNRNAERGFSWIWGLVIIVLMILAGVVLSNVLGGSGVVTATCGEQRDACVKNCGADIQCKHECESDFTTCGSRQAGRR